MQETHTGDVPGAVRLVTGAVVREIVPAVTNDPLRILKVSRGLFSADECGVGHGVVTAGWVRGKGNKR